MQMTIGELSRRTGMPVKAELAFADQGAHSLKGVPGDWRVFSVERGSWQAQ